MISLDAREVTHSYQDHVVLRQVNLEVPAGRCFAIVGHNGAGKSTLLRLLALLEPPTAGTVKALANGQQLAVDLALRRRMVMVLQRPFLFNGSVLANAGYGLKVRGVPRREARERAYHALGRVGLASLAHRAARTLSGGEAQLVNLARALAVEPEVLLLDEVTSHLDPDNEERVESIVRELAATGRITVVLVTQDVGQASRLADQGAVLRRGRVESVGSIPGLFGMARANR